MEALDLIKKIRKIEIKARGASKQLFSGQYHSAFKGRGMTFSEVREYQYGDETRTIDWNVTARFKTPFVKTFEEERELTVMLLVDVSGSESFGTHNSTKREYIAEVCAVLAFSAIQNNDKVGVIFFSDTVEKFIPPRKGKNHILRIIRDLLEFEPENKGTDITAALNHLNHAIKRKCTAFLLSDFLDSDYSQAFKMTNNKHDLLAVRIFDPKEQQLPKLGYMQLFDPESQTTKWVNSSSKTVQTKYKNWWRKKEEEFSATALKSGVDKIELNTSESYVKPILKAFNKRGLR